MDRKDFRENLKNKLSSISDEKLREAVREIEQILWLEQGNNNHNQFVVEYSTIKQAEKLAEYFKGTMMYGDKPYTYFPRLINSPNRFNHVFTFSIVDPKCEEVYFDSLGDIGKYTNSKRLPVDKVIFIYIKKGNIRKFANDRYLNWHWVNVSEYKSGGIIEV